jgi:hypothetical protein
VNVLKAFGRFWYDFIIGDDWKIAAAVVVALGVLLGALQSGRFGDRGLAILGGLTIIVLFAISLAIDVRPRKPPK